MFITFAIMLYNIAYLHAHKVWYMQIKMLSDYVNMKLAEL